MNKLLNLKNVFSLLSLKDKISITQTLIIYIIFIALKYFNVVHFSWLTVLTSIIWIPLFFLIAIILLWFVFVIIIIFVMLIKELYKRSIGE